MGRELRRVALDFAWPIGKVWEGFINPHFKARECRACDGTGYSEYAKRLNDLWYGYAPFKPEDSGSTPFDVTTPGIVLLATRNCQGETSGWLFREEAKRLTNLMNASWMHHLNDDDVKALVAEGRLRDFTSVWIKGQGWVKKDPPYIPTAREVNEWSIVGCWHDAINAWVCIKAACQRAGQDDGCRECQGRGHIWDDHEQEKIYEAWQPTDPPAGDGWQLWETVSEGSPVSPVFATAEDLANWLGEENHNGMGRDGWLKFLTKTSGWAPSLVAVDGAMMTGTEYAASQVCDDK